MRVAGYAQTERGLMAVIENLVCFIESHGWCFGGDFEEGTDRKDNEYTHRGEV